MKRKGSMVILFISMLALIISFCCGGPNYVLVTAITVSGEGNQETVIVGETLQMEADVLPENASNKAVTLSVENTDENTERRTRAEITQEGLLTGVSAGMVVVKATAKNGSEVEGTKEITIVPQTYTLIQGGIFQMGNTRNDSEGWSREKPVHTVNLTYDYYISQYQVTFDEYDAYCEDTKKTNPNDEGWGRGSRPVINVNW